MLAEALKTMLWEGKQHDMQRAAAFIKRLATFTLSFGSAEAMAGSFFLKHLLRFLFFFFLLTLSPSALVLMFIFFSHIIGNFEIGAFVVIRVDFIVLLEKENQYWMIATHIGCLGCEEGCLWPFKHHHQQWLLLRNMYVGFGVYWDDINGRYR